MTLKKIILICVLHLGLPYKALTQDIKNKLDQNQTLGKMTQAEKDWIEVDTMKTYFCKSEKEAERYYSLNFIEQRRFEDKIERKRMQLAEAFLNKYPNDEHYYDVLKYFFHYLLEPKFISNRIEDSTLALLSQDLKLAKKDRSFFYHQMRSLPIDKAARDQWLKIGNQFLKKFLESEAPLDQKAQIEMRHFGRDLRIAIFQYEYMDFQKKDIESDYWERFDRHYWESLLFRVKTILFKYPDLESMSVFVETFISLICRPNFSSELTEPYWRQFLEITDSKNPLANRIGIKAVNKMAKANLKGIEGLKDLDDSQPLEMSFKAMDGSDIDLKQMRGKIILLDFWSITCASCIKEMPHLRELYDKYKEKGLEIIGIVANGGAEKNQVLKIVENQKINWPQRLDKGPEATLSYHSLYKITALPTVWLLDKEGKVVDKNARGGRLEPLIKKYLNLD